MNEIYDLPPKEQAKAFIKWAFKENESGVKLWDDLQFDDDFLVKISYEMWFELYCQRINPIQLLLYKMLEIFVTKSEIKGIDSLCYMLKIDFNVFNMKFDEILKQEGDFLALVVIEMMRIRDITATRAMLNLMNSVHFDKKKYNFLHEAIETEDIDLVHFILKQYGKHFFPFTDQQDANIAHIAAGQYHAEMINLIHEQFGIDCFNTPNAQGKLAIHEARDLDVIIALLPLTKNMNTQDNMGSSMLHGLMSIDRDLEYWEQLLPYLTKCNVNFSLLNHEKNTSLHVALDFGRIDALKYILPHVISSLSVELLNDFLNILTRKGFKSVIDILLKLRSDVLIDDKTKRLLEHQHADELEDISSNLCLKKLSVGLFEMKYLVARLHQQWGEGFNCIVIGIKQLDSFIKQLKIKLQDLTSCQYLAIHYFLTGQGHWIWGQINIEFGVVKNILMVDSLIDCHPTPEVYDCFSTSFKSATIYLHGVLKQANDNYCPIYCYDDMNSLQKKGKYLPKLYGGNFFHYLDVHALKTEECLTRINNFRKKDVLCRLPAFMLRSNRSLNGTDDCYRTRGIIFWTRGLKQNEFVQFSEHKQQSLFDNMKKNIKDVYGNKLNVRIEKKLIGIQEKFVEFHLNTPPETIINLIKKTNIDTMFENISSSHENKFFI